MAQITVTVRDSLDRPWTFRYSRNDDGENGQEVWRLADIIGPNGVGSIPEKWYGLPVDENHAVILGAIARLSGYKLP